MNAGQDNLTVKQQNSKYQDNNLQKQKTEARFSSAPLRFSVVL